MFNILKSGLIVTFAIIFASSIVFYYFYRSKAEVKPFLSIDTAKQEAAPIAVQAPVEDTRINELEIMRAKAQLRQENKLTLNRLGFAKYPKIESWYQANSLENIKEILKIDEVLDSDFLNNLCEIPYRAEPPIGIRNKGNSCYADSAIQMLYRIPLVRTVVANLGVFDHLVKSRTRLLKSMVLDTLYTGENNELVQEYKNNHNNTITNIRAVEGLNYMFYQLQNGKQKQHCHFMYPLIEVENVEENKIVRSNPYKYYKAFQCMPGIFSTTKIEDASVYLGFVLDALMSVLPEEAQKRFEMSLKITKNVSEDGFDDETSFKYEKWNVLVLDFPDFTNLTKLLDTAATPEERNDIKLLCGGERLVNVNDMLKIFFFDYEYDNNSIHYHETKRITSLPDFISIQPRKSVSNDEVFDMLDEIDFAPFIDPNSFEGSTKYRRIEMFIELLVVPVEVESKTKGLITILVNHYRAYSLEPNGIWYCLNDENVFEVAESDIRDLIKKGYIYFYKRILE